MSSKLLLALSMSDRRRVSERIIRRVVVTSVAMLLFGWVFLYRFNTLSGGFGGFDNDHFLYFALAKQVQAGEQPLRDFQDAMHGAWPSLTYELSAAAQRLWGNNLRSEAWLTVGGVALAASLAFVAGATVAPWPWALLMAFVTALMSPKLYGYPKLLVMAAASLLIVSSQGVPTWRRIALMSAWTAIAFLFRHDYVVYCAIGFVTLIVLSGGVNWRDRIGRGALYAVITAVLLAPSLWWIQRYTGLTEYVRNAREMSRNEYERTRIGWPVMSFDGVQSPFDVFNRDENAEAWIYYVFVAIPLLVTGIAAWQVYHGANPDARGAALVAVSVTTLALWHFFLRGNLGIRVGEVGPSIVVISAWLLSRAFARGRSWSRTVLTGSAALAFVAVTVVCAWRLGEVKAELRTSRLLEPQDVLARTRQVSEELAGMPRSQREEQAANRMQAADYLHRCTRPTDRVIAIGYYPDVPAFSDRLFAGGRVTFFVGYYANERYTRETIAKLESQSVPIVLGGPEMDDRRLGLADYLHSHYDEVGTVAINEGSLRVWIRRGLQGEPSGPNGLPCFG
jgi:hypothetical protein